VPTQRSAMPFVLGARTGVLTTLRPSVRNTSSKGPEKLGVPISEQDVLVLEASGDRKVPSLLGDPGGVGSARRAGHVDPSRRELDEEQHVERLQQHRLDGKEVAGQRSPALRPKELAPGRTGAPWCPCRSQAGPAKDPPDRARSDPDPELAEFALDPYATPPRVLPAETDDEIGRVGIERGSTRTSPTVGPLPLDKLAMPAKQRLRRDHERCPAVPGECSARCREERPIPIAKLRAADRPSEHLHLVAEDGVLELKLGNAPMSGERPDEAKEDEVDEGSQRARMLPISVNQNRGIEFWSPTRCFEAILPCRLLVDDELGRGFSFDRCDDPSEIAVEDVGSDSCTPLIGGSGDQCREVLWDVNSQATDAAKQPAGSTTLSRGIEAELSQALLRTILNDQPVGGPGAISPACPGRPGSSSTGAGTGPEQPLRGTPDPPW
jgi:hypothetical protein